jgi:alkanesulfonate monooxygenase SsuD/methylene tetrahydromethanopterin reductase-like flavin-dependent oxidoreductase (luciferase family)
MTILRLAWTTENRFSHSGRFWNFAEVIIEPRHVQQPHPPLWLGAGSLASIERAARECYRLLLDQVGTFDLIAQRVATYRAAREAAGLAYAPTDIAVNRALRISRSKADRNHQLERHMASLTTLTDSSAVVTTDGQPANPFYSAPDARRDTAESSAIVGTLDKCIERLRTLQAGDVEQVLFTGASLADLRLFAAEIMPAFQ